MKELWVNETQWIKRNNILEVQADLQFTENSQTLHTQTHIHRGQIEN